MRVCFGGLGYIAMVAFLLSVYVGPHHRVGS